MKNTKRSKPSAARTGSAIDRAIARVTRWDVTGYYSCNKCGWKGDRPRNHDTRCIEAVFVKPMPTARLVGCATFAEEWNHRVDLGTERKKLSSPNSDYTTGVA